MDSEKFKVFLKNQGKSAKSIERIVNFSADFDEFMRKKGKSIDEAAEADLYEFTGRTKREIMKKKLNLWGLIFYYEFTENEKMKNLSRKLRGSVSKKSSFPLKEFVDVDKNTVGKLEAEGIKDADKLLKTAFDKKSVEILSEKTGITEEQIVKLVKLADLSRLNGVKGIRAVLYYNSGFDTLEKIGESTPEEMIERTKIYIEKTGFKGIPPWGKEARETIKMAKRLKKIIDL
ncbi:MAG: chlorosome envelope protein [Kosmotogales bacterium]|nr:chlorosome envelope protein [Kosmotogales bacterium]